VRLFRVAIVLLDLLRIRKELVAQTFRRDNNNTSKNGIITIRRISTVGQVCCWRYLLAVPTLAFIIVLTHFKQTMDFYKGQSASSCCEASPLRQNERNSKRTRVLLLWISFVADWESVKVPAFSFGMASDKITGSWLVLDAECKNRLQSCSIKNTIFVLEASFVCV
jgi:hypothetical protein